MVANSKMEFSSSQQEITCLFYCFQGVVQIKKEDEDRQSTTERGSQHEVANPFLLFSNLKHRKRKSLTVIYTIIGQYTIFPV